MTILELQPVEANADRARMLAYVAGCHGRDVKDALRFAIYGHKDNVAARIDDAIYSARLAWRVALAIDSSVLLSMSTVQS